MSFNKNKVGNLQPMTVTDGVTVNVLPYEQHEYLMTTREVAHGYGVSEYAIRQNKTRLEAELIEGKHFVKGVTISNTLKNAQPRQVFWTKRGVIRLGFAMRGERAKLFRDWAEELIIKVDEQRNLFGEIEPPKALPKRRRHNRLTQTRLVDILAEVCKIEDKKLRMSITNKLMGAQ